MVNTQKLLDHTQISATDAFLKKKNNYLKKIKKSEEKKSEANGDLICNKIIKLQKPQEPQELHFKK